MEYIYCLVKDNNKNTEVCQVTFFNNNNVYVFTLFAYEKISDENMTALKNMLNTIKFES